MSSLQVTRCCLLLTAFLHIYGQCPPHNHRRITAYLTLTAKTTNTNALMSVAVSITNTSRNVFFPSSKQHQVSRRETLGYLPTLPSSATLYIERASARPADLPLTKSKKKNTELPTGLWGSSSLPFGQVSFSDLPTNVFPSSAMSIHSP